MKKLEELTKTQSHKAEAELDEYFEGLHNQVLTAFDDMEINNLALNKISAIQFLGNMYVLAQTAPSKIAILDYYEEDFLEKKIQELITELKTKFDEAVSCLGDETSLDVADDANGDTALHYLTKFKAPFFLIKALVELGANPCSFNHDGISPLHNAAHVTPAVIVQRRSNETDADFICRKSIMAEHLRVKALDVLIAHGGDILQMDAKGRNLLHHLLMGSAPAATIEHILMQCTNINLQTEDKMSPLHYAVAIKSPHREDVVALLLKEGANPLLKDDKGATPLDYAKHLKLGDVQTLLESHIAEKPELSAQIEESTASWIFNTMTLNYWKTEPEVVLEPSESSETENSEQEPDEDNPGILYQFYQSASWLWSNPSSKMIEMEPLGTENSPKLG